MANIFRTPEQRQHWNKYNSKYSSEHYKNICLKLNLETEKDMIDFLARHGNSKFLKKAIREAIARGE